MNNNKKSITPNFWMALYIIHFNISFCFIVCWSMRCKHLVEVSWYATPVRWMDYLGKGEVLTNTDLDRFVNNIWEKWAFYVHRKSPRSLSSAHEKWGQKQVLHLYFFQCVYIYTHIYIYIYIYILIWYPNFLSKRMLQFSKTQKIEPDPNFFMTDESFRGSV